MKPLRITLLALLLLTACAEPGAKTNIWTNVAELEQTAMSVVNKTAQVDDIRGAARSVRNYYIDIAAGTTNLSFATSGGTGDVDLYIRLGELPSGKNHDCRSITYTNEDSCAFETPNSGRYYITLFGASAYEGVTLTASLDETVPDPEPEPEDPDAPAVCEENTCVDGRGLQLYTTNPGQRLYKNENGWVTLPNSLPSALNGTDFLTYDKYPDYGGDESSYTDDRDSRTDEIIARVQSSDDGELLIAVASDDAATNGWERIDSEPAFVLETEDSSTPSYWLYSYDNANPQTWIDLPSGANADLPPFVFAPEGQLTFANPLPLPSNGVRIVMGNKQVFNPTMTIIPGDFDADGDGFGDGDLNRDGAPEVNVYLAAATGARLWKVWRSLDEGETWESWGKPIVNLNRQTLFFHNGGVYLMGWVKRSAKLDNGDPAQGIIYQSLDGGRTWGEPTLLPFPAGDAPSNVVVSDGRIWKAAGSLDEDGNHGATLISAPVDANLMDASSWTAAEGSFNPAWDARIDEVRTVGSKDVEGITVLLKDDRVANMSNARGAAIVYSDGYQRTTHNPKTDVVDLPERGKFSVMYDPETGRYWALTNGPNGQPRNIINLFSSSDLRTWRLEREVLRGPSSRYHGFNYPNMQIDGEDIVFVSRTAWETSRGHNGRWHDGNMLTFHRIEDFRQ